jgi:hypothetical protein
MSNDMLAEVPAEQMWTLSDDQKSAACTFHHFN